MSDAPEKIWVMAYYSQNRSEHVQEWSQNPFEGKQQYEFVRTDTIPSAAYVAGLEAALREARETILDLIHARNSDAEGSDEDWTAEIDAALASRPASSDVRVVVKPLEWRKQSGACEIADTPWGAVAVQDESHALAPKRWGWWMVGSGEDDSPSGYGIDIDAAKAAAQADYERRILSAIIGGQS